MSSETRTTRTTRKKTTENIEEPQIESGPSSLLEQAAAWEGVARNEAERCEDVDAEKMIAARRNVSGE